MAEGRAEDLAEGREAGRAESKIEKMEIARRLRAMGLDVYCEGNFITSLGTIVTSLVMIVTSLVMKFRWVVTI